MKVLLVEDDDFLRAGYLKQLEKSGLALEVFAAGSVDEAVRIADQVHPEMIVLDLHLGTGQNGGLKVYDHVRGQPYGKGAFIVAVTAYSTSDVKSMLESRGLNRVLFKADYHSSDDQIVSIVRDRISSPQIEKPVSSPAGMAALSDQEKLNQALHDLADLIHVKGAVCFSPEDKLQLKRLADSLEVSPAENPTLEDTARSTTAPNLLIVEDEPAQQAAIAKALEALGYHVTVANGISDAKSRMEGQNFDAYLVDVLLQGGKKGTDILRLLTVEQGGNVVFMSARPDQLQELQHEGARVYDKTSRQVHKLLELVHQVAPLQVNYLVNEKEIADRGRRLIGEIQHILSRDYGTSLADSDVAEKCKAFADSVLKDPSVDTNKYIVASDYLGRALKQIEGIPFMVKSRRVCVESHSKAYERRLFGTRRYLLWFVHRVFWGGITGYGYSLKRIAATFGIIFLSCIALMAIKPEAFRFSMNNKELAAMTGGERWWSSVFIAGCHGLLVSTEAAAPVSQGAQFLTLLQTILSVLLLALLVGAITFRIKQGG